MAMLEKRVALGESREALMAALSPAEMEALRSDPDLVCVGAARSGDLFVHLTDDALQDMRRATSETEPLQQAGVLLGEVRQAGEGYALRIAHAVPFEKCEAERDRVRVQRRSWTEVLRVKALTYPRLRVVGWYHGPAGLGSQISDTDKFVQRYFFPAEWQVACVLDLARGDVRFFQRRGRNVNAVAGFHASRALAADLKAIGDSASSVSTDLEPPAPPVRLIPRAASPAAPASAPRPERAPVRTSSDEGERRVIETPQEAPRTPSDNYLRDRFIERSLEKIVRLLHDPPARPRELVMMGMIAVVGILLFALRPAPGPTQQQWAEMTQKLDQVSERLERLEARPRVAPAPAAPRPVAAAPAPAPRPRVPAAGQPDAVHRLQDGESLWSISETYYQDGRLMDALMAYNQISRPEDLKVGEPVRIPSRKKLAAFNRTKAGKKPAR